MIARNRSCPFMQILFGARQPLHGEDNESAIGQISGRWRLTASGILYFGISPEMKHRRGGVVDCTF